MVKPMMIGIAGLALGGVGLPSIIGSVDEGVNGDVLLADEADSVLSDGISDGNGFERCAVCVGVCAVKLAVVNSLLETDGST